MGLGLFLFVCLFNYVFFTHLETSVRCDFFCGLHLSLAIVYSSSSFVNFSIRLQHFREEDYGLHSTEIILSTHMRVYRHMCEGISFQTTWGQFLVLFTDFEDMISVVSALLQSG